MYDQEVQSMRHRADSTKSPSSALDLIDLFETRGIWSGRVWIRTTDILVPNYDFHRPLRTTASVFSDLRTADFH